MSRASLPLARGFGETNRRDAWWLQPLATFVMFTTILTYMTWAAFQNGHYTFGNYLSPLYSPVIFGDGPHALLGPKPSIWPAWVPFSPALIILPFPGLFRFTCYYYRGAYYKAFWADPINCAVGEPRTSYLGENSFPLILQNIHRYFLYISVVFLFILSWDVYKALWFTAPDGSTHFGVGVGTVVLAGNVTCLSMYTLGCHAMRHVIGGFKDELTGHKVRKVAYDCASCLNRGHMNWALVSFVWVASTDLYVRLCSMGVWTDYRLF